MNLHRRIWWGIALLCGLIGFVNAVTSSSILATVLVFAILALCLGLLSATLRSVDGQGRGGPVEAPTVIRHGCIAGFAVVAFFGMTDLAGSAVLPLLVVLALTCPTVVDHWRAARTNHQL